MNFAQSICKIGWGAIRSLFLAALLSGPICAADQANQLLIVNDGSVSKEFSTVYEIANLATFGSTYKARLVGKGGMISGLKGQIVQIVQFPSSSENLTEVASDTERLQRATDELRVVAQKYERARVFLTPVIQDLARNISFLQGGNVRVAGKWISKDEYARVQAEANKGVIASLTVKGKLYTKVRLKSVLQGTITFSHDVGFAKIAIADLDEQDKRLLASTFNISLDQINSSSTLQGSAQQATPSPPLSKPQITPSVTSVPISIPRIQQTPSSTAPAATGASRANGDESDGQHSKFSTTPAAQSPARAFFPPAGKDILTLQNYREGDHIRQQGQKVDVFIWGLYEDGYADPDFATYFAKHVSVLDHKAYHDQPRSFESRLLSVVQLGAEDAAKGSPPRFLRGFDADGLLGPDRSREELLESNYGPKKNWQERHGFSIESMKIGDEQKLEYPAVIATNFKLRYDDAHNNILQKAATKGEPEAQYKLGVMYANGKDAAKAFEWWQKAAAKGHAVAQYNVGLMYATGEGVPKDTAKASEWWQKAAAQGNADAQYNLGVMYSKGGDVSKDEAKAFEWWQKAAAQGVARAQFDVGLMYAKGQGVPKNEVRAYAWCNLAAAQGHTNAATLRDLLEGKLTPDQLAAAEKLSSELFAKMPKR